MIRYFQSNLTKVLEFGFFFWYANSNDAYFENTESFIICYKYNKPIRSTNLILTN